MDDDVDVDVDADDDAERTLNFAKELRWMFALAWTDAAGACLALLQNLPF